MRRLKKPKNAVFLLIFLATVTALAVSNLFYNGMSKQREHAVLCPGINPMDNPSTFSTTYIQRMDERLQRVFRKYSDANRTIILSFVEYTYVDIAINLYVSSFARFGITNYVMISSDKQTCDILSPLGINCVPYAGDLKVSNTSSRYGSDAFRERTHTKTRLVLHALRFDYTVIFTDLDIVFLKNPIPKLMNESFGMDLTIQREGVNGIANSGFYVAKPTHETIFLFTKIAQCEAQNLMFSEQYIMNHLLSSLSKVKIGKVKYLSPLDFPSGNVYWESRKLMFPQINPLENKEQRALIAHNNWIVGGAAKIYRFKETLMWENDRNKYYSNPSGKYIVYGNPFDSENGSTVVKMEESALINALSIGFMLNRTVILPAFHCYGCTDPPCQNEERKCSLQARYNIEIFDMRFAGMYREHMFLQNKLVPERIRNFRAKEIIILTKFVQDKILKGFFSDNSLTYIPETPEGATMNEIVHWFGKNNDAVLKFYCLYDSFAGFPNEAKFKDIKYGLETSLTHSGYRQYVK